MENSFQTSFIPKKSVVPNGYSAKSPTSFFTIISIIILIITGVSAGGLFLYKGVLDKQKEGAAESISKAGDYFNKDTISELQLFDKRVSASKKILTSHTVFSPLFALIGDLTIPSVQYTKFDERVADKGFVVTMSGIARDYKSVALQAGVFNTTKGRYLKDVIFSNLTKDKDNYITFDLNFTVDPTLLSYEKNNLLEQSQPQADSTTTPSPVTDTTSTIPPASASTTTNTPLVPDAGNVNKTTQ